MSDDVQRYMMYYDDLVPDDKGTWIRLEDYEALRVRIDEQLASGEVVLLTRGQIDAAWERLMYYKNSKEFKDQLIWQCIGTILEPFNIVACEECGGSGVVREHERGYEDGVEDTCPSCNGHGWVIK